MIVKDVVSALEANVSAGDGGLENEVETAYIGDLLSWVMGKAPGKCAWVTICGHINVVAVGVLIECACIIVAENAAVEEGTIQKANAENLPVLRTRLSAFEVSKRLCGLGL